MCIATLDWQWANFTKCAANGRTIFEDPQTKVFNSLAGWNTLQSYSVYIYIYVVRVCLGCCLYDFICVFNGPERESTRMAHYEGYRLDWFSCDKRMLTSSRFPSCLVLPQFWTLRAPLGTSFARFASVAAERGPAWGVGCGCGMAPPVPYRFTGPVGHH